MANPVIPNFADGFQDVDGTVLEQLSIVLQTLLGQRAAATALNVLLGNATLSGLLYESAADGITAHAGGGQSGAFALTSEVNKITTVATPGDSVSLPPSAPGLTIFLINVGANPMQVFGAGSDLIDGQANGVSQMQGSSVIYSCTTAGAWATNGIGTGYVGSFPTVSSTNGIVAHAGGGQASAVPLSTVINRVTTVATANDSVVLPAAAPGLQITVNNASGNSLNVFPAGTDAINALAAGSAYALAGGKTTSFTSTVAGIWHSLT